MNGFKMLSDSYRKLSEQGKITEQEAEQQCRVLDFLSTCNDNELCMMFDTGAFNEIAKSYMRLTVKQLEAEGTIDEEQARAIRNRYSLLFDEKQAAEVYK